MTTSPRRVEGRTLIDRDPDQLVWILSARESADRKDQLANQLTDLRALVRSIGGRIDREVPENAVSSYKKTRISLPDGTYGYRVVRPDWEDILTGLRRRECNALAVADLDRATRDPRILEDLIEVVEHYGAYVVSLTGNIDLTTDAGISAARGLVNQRNQESRNTSRRVATGKRHAALKGKNNGGPLRPFGWRKDRKAVNKREQAHILRELPRIRGGVSAVTIAREWKERGIPTVSGAEWRSTTVNGIFTNPRICGIRTYDGEILRDESGNPVRGEWNPILTVEQWEEVCQKWKPSKPQAPSRLGATGTGSRTKYLLSPFLRCGKCNARMSGTLGVRDGKRVELYICPGKGLGGCGGTSRIAKPINDYITALVIADHRRIQFQKEEEEGEEQPPWPKAKELADLQERINDSTQRYEAGEYSAERYFPSLARMEAREAQLKREKRTYENKQQSRRRVIVDLEKRWNEPDFTLEQKHEAIAKSLSAVIIRPAGRGVRFHPDQIEPVFNEEHESMVP
ncbi:recombinase family protein [Nonomuraea sp. CA-143628]|uniref:recombinase family protein n=1 Tax=Nonomuraea sp. CA-143628 TaxID=3239997 RepID=UPI003D8E860F